MFFNAWGWSCCSLVASHCSRATMQLVSQKSLGQLQRWVCRASSKRWRGREAAGGGWGSEFSLAVYMVGRSRATRSGCSLLRLTFSTLRMLSNHLPGLGLGPASPLLTCTGPDRAPIEPSRALQLASVGAGPRLLIALESPVPSCWAGRRYLSRC